MNILITIFAVVALIALRFVKLNMLGWIVAWWIAVYAVVRYGISPPMPGSIIQMFMGIVSVALLTYVFTSSARVEATKRPIVSFLVEKKYTIPLLIVVIALPLLVGFNVYRNASKKISAPVFGRTVHPAPPQSMTFEGKTIDLINGHNPYRELEESDPDKFREHVGDGRRVYFENCVFCHGDNMDGDGIFAHALNPIPASFADATTIAMLQETYLFWRVAKGAPGLPEASEPWASAMPAWEKFLTEEEIWNVIIFLYEHTDQRPRSGGHEEGH